MNPESGTLDDDAMRRLQADDQEALNALMDRWQMPLVRFLARVVHDGEEALDLAQETFARIYEHRSRYRPGSNFKPWLFAIATNLARNHNRWKARHPADRFHHEERQGSVEPVASGPRPDSELQRKELSAAVRDAVGQLPDDLRLALILAEYEGMSHEEIGKTLRCTAKAVEMRLYRARASLRKALARFL